MGDEFLYGFLLLLARIMFRNIVGIHDIGDTATLFRNEYIGGKRFDRFIAIATRRESLFFSTLHEPRHEKSCFRIFR